MITGSIVRPVREDRSCSTCRSVGSVIATVKRSSLRAIGNTRYRLAISSGIVCTDAWSILSLRRSTMARPRWRAIRVARSLDSIMPSLTRTRPKGRRSFQLVSWASEISSAVRIPTSATIWPRDARRERRGASVVLSAVPLPERSSVSSCEIAVSVFSIISSSVTGPVYLICYRTIDLASDGSWGRESVE